MASSPTKLQVSSYFNHDYIRNIAKALGFAFFIVFPSTGTVQKFLGNFGFELYLIASVTLIVLLYLKISHLQVLGQMERQWKGKLNAIVAVLLFSLLALFAIIYPAAQSGLIGGGSDADDALNIAATALLHGDYPYGLKTPLGNPVAPLPGAIFLALPFVIFGNSAFQNFFWLVVYFYIAANFLESRLLTAWMLAVILIGSPVVLQNLLTGTDRMSNAIYILTFIYLSFLAMSTRDLNCGLKLLCFAMLGITLASRFNFLFLLPVLISFFIQNSEERYLSYALSVISGFLIVVVPILLWDPSFISSVLVQSNKLADLSKTFPLPDVVIPLATFFLALGLSFQNMQKNMRRLLLNCGLILCFPILIIVLLMSESGEGVDLLRSEYGVFFLFFGALALWPDRKSVLLR